jgi:hypothetical protein
MRRLEPESWKRCRTCQQDFDYSPLYRDSPLHTAILSYLLDHRWALRSILFAFSSTLLSLLPWGEYYHRLLTSTMLWQLVCLSLSLLSLISRRAVSTVADDLSSPASLPILVPSDHRLVSLPSLSLAREPTRGSAH